MPQASARATCSSTATPAAPLRQYAAAAAAAATTTTTTIATAAASAAAYCFTRAWPGPSKAAWAALRPGVMSRGVPPRHEPVGNRGGPPGATAPGPGARAPAALGERGAGWPEPVCPGVRPGVCPGHPAPRT